MSLFSELTSTAVEAQGIFIDMTGEGEFIITGDSTTYSGVLNEFDAMDPLTPAAIKTIRMLKIKATKAQFSAPPSSAPRTTLTVKGVKWTITSITDTPLFYFFNCKPV